MDSDTVITVEDLSKRYRLGQIGATSLRESAERWWHKMRGRNPDVEMGEVGSVSSELSVGLTEENKAPESANSEALQPCNSANSATLQPCNSATPCPGVAESEDGCHSATLEAPPRHVWALKDVSFEVKRGEVLGVIGKNGAGKSTLLKILTRITEPTEGRAIMRGRVASLLEVGTGFHPELTGRENVFLNGAILGMKRLEIASKFDEIVEFSEIGKFIDTPVKRYSSGMYVRLAFAVAAHLDPEILLVDEVLAVGDIAFQRKCIGKMDDVAKTGRTVLFVSHNMASVLQICNAGILLDQGCIVSRGQAGHVVETYMSSDMTEEARREWPDGIANPGVDEFRLISISIEDAAGQFVGSVDSTRGATVHIEYKILKPVSNCRIGLRVATLNGVDVFISYDMDKDGSTGLERQPGLYRAKVRIPGMLLNEGKYALGAIAGIYGVKNFITQERALVLSVSNMERQQSFFGERRKGVIFPELEWSTTSLSNEYSG